MSTIPWLPDSEFVECECEPPKMIQVRIPVTESIVNQGGVFDPVKLVLNSVNREENKWLFDPENQPWIKVEVNDCIDGSLDKEVVFYLPGLTRSKCVPVLEKTLAEIVADRRRRAVVQI
jgi:hypothetical protein